MPSKLPNRCSFGKIFKTCLTQEHYETLNGILSKNVTWNCKIPPLLSKQQFNQLVCPSDKQDLALQQIMPKHRLAPKLCYYHNCPANLYAALKRQCLSTPSPNSFFLKKFKKWFDVVIQPEISELLKDFDYSFNVWFNHLTYKQQKEIEPFMVGNPDYISLQKRFASIFCKAEKQLCENNKLPKNRCISALCAAHKYCMGPIVYALEQYFVKFKGYGGGKSWPQLANKYLQWDQAEYKAVQSDFSGYDRTVSAELKEIVFFSIYKLIEPHVKHIDTNTYARHAYSNITTIYAEYFGKNMRNNLGSATIKGQVFSGSMDTTLMNTILTTVLMRYTIEEVLKIPNHDYDLINKGDDSVVLLPHNIPNDNIVNAYKHTFVFQDNSKNDYINHFVQHGSGLQLKFLSIGQIDDIDFCSTQTFKCKKCNNYKITRKLDRFVSLTPWSRTIIDLKPEQQLAYKQNLYEANCCWMKGLPIFEQLNQYLKTGVKADYNLVGKQKKTLPLTQIETSWYFKYFDSKKMAKFEKLSQAFGKEDAYQMIERINNTQDCCGKAYIDWLVDKSHSTSYSIELICKELSNDLDQNSEYTSYELESLLHTLEISKNDKIYR